MFEMIAVPVDGSDYGYKAADVAIEIAKKFNSKIAAVHVLRNSPLTAMLQRRIQEMRFLQRALKRRARLVLKLSSTCSLLTH